MKTEKVQVLVIGAGPAGLCAAIAARKAGAARVVILERDNRVGGILPQCIHNGFGLHRFGEELTGPEYALRLADEAKSVGVAVKLNTTVISVTPGRTVKATSLEEGVVTYEADALVLAMGCRERARGALNIPGTRPAGVYTAGCAQKLVNIMGYMPGKRVVILGSGDIGLIMARRMTLEGAKVEAVCELMPYSGGLARNIQQCLVDFDIPLLLSHTVTEIRGDERLEGVTVTQVDENRRPIAGTERYISCDTLLLSCGLIPENELTEAAGIPLDRVTGGASVNDRRETAAAGVFACGNVLHVHDLADYASDEGEIAGKSAAEFAAGKESVCAGIPVRCAGAVRYTVPQSVIPGDGCDIYFRVAAPVKNVTVRIYSGDNVCVSKKKRSLTPGEMQKERLTPEFTSAVSKEITVEVIPAEE